jgi:hypothetical protein
MIRVCPHSDAKCVHGMNCAYTCATDAYDGNKNLMAEQNASRTHAPEGEVARLLTYANSHKLPDEEPIGVTNLKWGDLRAFAGKPLYASPVVPVPEGGAYAGPFDLEWLKAGLTNRGIEVSTGCSPAVAALVALDHYRGALDGNPLANPASLASPVVPVGREGVAAILRPMVRSVAANSTFTAEEREDYLRRKTDAILAALHPTDPGEQ